MTEAVMEDCCSVLLGAEKAYVFPGSCQSFWALLLNLPELSP